MIHSLTSGLAAMDDYDLNRPLRSDAVGLKQGLTSYGDSQFSLFLRKVFIKAAGYSEDALSRPIIGIINTFSGFNPCHAQVPQLIDAVKRGVHLGGGLAIEFPTISLHESFSSPTSMYLRQVKVILGILPRVSYASTSRRRSTNDCTGT